MSIQERIPNRPASEWSPEEWEEHKHRVDEHLRAQGKPPADWSKMRQPSPRPLTDADRAWGRELAERFGL